MRRCGGRAGTPSQESSATSYTTTWRDGSCMWCLVRVRSSVRSWRGSWRVAVPVAPGASPGASKVSSSCVLDHAGAPARRACPRPPPPRPRREICGRNGFLTCVRVDSAHARLAPSRERRARGRTLDGPLPYPRPPHALAAQRRGVDARARVRRARLAAARSSMPPPRPCPSLSLPACSPHPRRDGSGGVGRGARASPVVPRRRASEPRGPAEDSAARGERRPPGGGHPGSVRGGGRPGG